MTNKSKNNFRKFLLAAAFILTVTSNSYAENYSLLNPVPENKLRSMTTERPSKTSSSFTVDSGHLQIETNFYSLTKDKNHGAKTTTKSTLAGTMFRLGLTQSSELSIVTSPVIWQKTESSNIRAQGVTLLRLRYNFFGNNPDKGGSFAAIPYIKIPTNNKQLGNNSYEGGVKLHYDGRFKDDYIISYLFEPAAVKKSDNSAYTASFTNVFDFGKAFTSKFYAYAELASTKSLERHTSSQNNLDFGVIYQVTKNFTLDAVTNFGISKSADNFNFLTGGSYRF